MLDQGPRYLIDALGAKGQYPLSSGEWSWGECQSHATAWMEIRLQAEP